MSNQCMAIIFINLYCLFDNFDNINVKVAMERDVGVIDLALARILLNFIAACVMVRCSGKRIIADVPGNFKFALSYRSVMILVDQILNVYAISLLSLGVVTIL